LIRLPSDDGRSPEPGALINGQFRIDRCLTEDSFTSAGEAHTLALFVGVDLATGESVHLLELPSGYLASLSRAVDVKHPNLCSVITVLPRAGGRGLAVFESVEGKSFVRELSRSRVFNALSAVTAALDLADALVGMHQRGAAHGLLRPAAVVLEPRGRAGAVLGWAPPLPEHAPHPYAPPERRSLTRTGPAPADDVWALAALLHEMLVGSPPPRQGYWSEVEVSEAGVRSPELAELLSACLAAQPEQRITLMQPVRDRLAAWFEAALAGVPRADAVTTQESLVLAARPQRARLISSSGILGATSPSLPAAPSEGPTSSVFASRPALWLGALAVAGLTAALLMRLPAESSNATHLAARVDAARVDGARALMDAPGTGAASTGAPGTGDPGTGAPSTGAPSTGDQAALEPIAADELPSSGDLASCVARHFPTETFRDEPRVEWLCSTPEAKDGVVRMRAALVGAAAGHVTPGMNLWSRLGWYRTAAYALIRSECCPTSAALRVASPPGCDAPDVAVAEVVRAVAELVRASSPGTASEAGCERELAEYTRIMRCQSRRGHYAVFGADGPLAAGEDSAFRELVQARASANAKP
jgi:hypothetical protein